jgi:O-glycosyl hydrolase
MRGFSESEVEPLLASRAKEAAQLGARMVRGHTANYPYTSWYVLQKDPSRIVEMDRWVTALQANGLEPIAMVSPWPGNQTGNYTESYLPDLDSYRRYVQQLVERYDGDGVEDMPGLRAPVRYWEVDNEPDLKNTNLPRDNTRNYDPSTFCTPSEYAKVLIASSQAIKAAYPEAKVLNGGPYRPAVAGTYTYMSEVLKVEGALSSFDILSLHTYADDAQRLRDGIVAMRSLVPDKPVWITEISTPSTPSPESRERQATLLLQDVTTAALSGASVLLWHSLGDPPGGRGKGYSLTDMEGGQGFSVKPAGEMYQHLATILAAHDLNGATEEEPGHVRLRDGSLILTEGSMNAPTGGTNLRTGAEIPAGATASSPAWLSKT